MYCFCIGQVSKFVVTTSLNDSILHLPVRDACHKLCNGHQALLLVHWYSSTLTAVVIDSFFFLFVLVHCAKRACMHTHTRAHWHIFTLQTHNTPVDLDVMPT